MAFNVKDGIEVPLSTFGGLVTEMTPQDLPEGVSPDCQDVVFVPGSVMTRPGLQRVFAETLGSGTSILYGKSYVLPTGKILNLYLNNLGQIYVEDPVNTPGVTTILYTTAAGNRVKSVTAFGREYIAISDGLHGQDIPLQYDGTYLDRLTQDGPGACASVASLILPPVSMAPTGGAPVLTLVEADPANEQPDGFYTGINLYISSSVASLSLGQYVTVSGNSSAAMNGTFGPITAIFPGTGGGNSLVQASAYFPSGTAYGLGGSVTTSTGNTMVRQNNVVTVTTSTPHQLQIGYQALITGVAAAVVGTSVVTIKIDNEDFPGIATVTTSTPHGLVPGLFVSLTNITAGPVGGTITSASRQGGIITIITSTPHNLAPGASVTLSAVTDSSFNSTFFVSQVVSPTGFTVLQPSDPTNSTSSGGQVLLNWPVPDLPTPQYFEVIAAPTATTFQVQINYPDGTWTTGTASYAWDGTFYVASVPNSTTFTYQQYGPNATTSTIGTVTPNGQSAPGQHQMQVAFLTRQGYITRPSPPVKFIANGGQYVSVTNIPIGASNVVARILMFTGAQGDYFFYIPVPAQINGQVVSTATQVNDNITTSVVLDFADNTLFASVSVDIPGNNIANQRVIDGALGFGSYDTRLITYGQRNNVQNFLNMGFDGGYFSNSPTLPLGWSSLDHVGALTPSTNGIGFVWKITPPVGAGQYGVLTQSAYEDAYGAPIIQPNTFYKIRVKLAASAPTADLSFTAKLSSVSTGYSSTAVITGLPITSQGAFLEAAFNHTTPASIPQDLILTIYATCPTQESVFTVDELELIYVQTPYLDTILFGSYSNNPEAFDGVTGKFGAADDTKKMLELGIIRNTLYLLTQEPSGRIHEVSATGTSEPAGWDVSEVGANCGILSTFALAKSQADDTTASGGEEWLAWASASGARIFDGSQPWKISQELQPDWDRINPAAYGQIWTLNDSNARVIYFGLPTGSSTVCNLVYPLNYRELDTPFQIFTGAPVRVAASGRLIASDVVRKWTRWNLAFNGASQMYRSSSKLTTCFLGAAFGNVYTLSNLMTDQDYGQIFAYYTTYLFVNHDLEIALQLGAHRKTLKFTQTTVSGIGNFLIQVLLNNLTNFWPYTGVRPLVTNPTFDLEWSGGNAEAQRMAFKLSATPLAGQTDAYFNLDKFVVTLQPSQRKPVRGYAL